MTVLVTGGAGYIGSHTVHDLVDAGESVVVLDNLSTGFASALPRPMLPIVGDQALVSALIDEHEVEAIIHFAGSTIVPESMTDPLGYYGNNIANSRALIEAAVKGGVKHFIFSSTAAVYGNPARVPVAEDDPTVPLSPYGRDASAAHPQHARLDPGVREPRHHRAPCARLGTQADSPQRRGRS
jgi:UDP-glucose 4-epimerase